MGGDMGGGVAGGNMGGGMAGGGMAGGDTGGGMDGGDMGGGIGAGGAGAGRLLGLGAIDAGAPIQSLRAHRTVCTATVFAHHTIARNNGLGNEIRGSVVIEVIQITFRHSDTDLASNGPGGKSCQADYQMVDEVLFDMAFTCNCDAVLGSCVRKSEHCLNRSSVASVASPSGRSGSNCEVVSTAPVPAHDNKNSIIIGAVLGALLLIIVIYLTASRIHRYYVKMKPHDFDETFEQMVACGDISEEHLLCDRKPREIRRRDLVMVKQIGNGQYGEVFKGILDEMFTRGTPEYTVAAKTVLIANESSEAKRELLSEASLMAQVAGHRNLVSIIGVITRGDPLVLVLQYCEHGSCLDELQTRAAEGSPVEFVDKMLMAFEISCGMEHLASLRFIHRDLAARNVLVADGKSNHAVSSDPRHRDSVGPTHSHRGRRSLVTSGSKQASMVCKVADFGLSRSDNLDRLQSTAGSPAAYYKSSNGVFPIKWTAPEAMEGRRFSEASDVWSFAIVLVELMQNGVDLYHGLSNPDVMKLVLSGGQHPKPAGNDCPDELYTFMLQCWNHDASKRPTFKDVTNFFAKPIAPPVCVRRPATFVSAENEYAGFDDVSDAKSDIIKSGVANVLDANFFATRRASSSNVYADDTSHAGIIKALELQKHQHQPTIGKHRGGDGDGDGDQDGLMTSIV